MSNDQSSAEEMQEVLLEQKVHQLREEIKKLERGNDTLQQMMLAKEREAVKWERRFDMLVEAVLRLKGGTP